MREEDTIRHALREGMSRLASGVVILTNWIDARPWGTTISSCTSLSMHPPLVLVCVASRAISARAILEQCCFGVNVLAADQLDVAIRGAAPGQPKFIDDLVSQEAEMGSPVLNGALASIHCELYNAMVVGDHTVIVGEVRDISFGRGRSPLIYFNRDFHDLVRQAA